MILRGDAVWIYREVNFEIWKLELNFYDFHYKFCPLTFNARRYSKPKFFKVQYSKGTIEQTYWVMKEAYKMKLGHGKKKKLEKDFNTTSTHTFNSYNFTDLQECWVFPRLLWVPAKRLCQLFVLSLPAHHLCFTALHLSDQLSPTQPLKTAWRKEDRVVSGWVAGRR